MRGRYRVISGGKVVAETDNLVTAAGREAVLRFLAGDIGAWAASMVFGVGSTPPTVNDLNLEFEAFRSPIVFRSADVPAGEIVLRAELNPVVAGNITEIGVWSTDANIYSEYPSELITDFDPDNAPDGLYGEDEGFWVPTDGPTRIGTASILLNGPGTATLGIPFDNLDFSGYLGSDKMSLAYISTGDNPSSVAVRMYTTDTDYYNYSFAPSGTNGQYRIRTWERSQFTPVGTPNWASIQKLEVVATNAAGQGVILDGLRVDDSNRYNDFSFVSRAVLSEPISTVMDEDTYVEYRFGAF